MKLIETPHDRILMEGDFPGFSPEELFAYWTDPAKVAEFWAPVGQVEHKVGGYYKFEWPKQGWYVHGRYSAFEPGRKLDFTWTWNFDEDVYTPLQVAMTFEPIEGGTRLTIDHRGYEDEESRNSTIGGWEHFCGKLAALRNG